MLKVVEQKKPILLSKIGDDYVMASPDKKAAEWLDAYVALSQDGVIAIVDDLTPARARVLLGRNDSNRKLSERLVFAYARDVKNDAWELNGQSLIISKEGLMNDGQHRCHAVINADAPLRTLFTFGVERETRTSVDQGRVRTAADYLSMTGYKNATVLATAANHIWSHKNNKYLTSGGYSKANKGEIRHIVLEYPNLMKSVDKAVASAGSRAVGGPAMCAFAHWTFARASKEAAADEFIEGLCEGAGLSRRNPILYARNRLIKERGKLRPNDRAELIFKAWNAWRSNQDLTQLYITGGELPKVEK